MESQWYVADLLFAQPSERECEPVLCESCLVLFEAPTAELTYARALDWARNHEQDSGFRFVGVKHIHSLTSPPCDGCEVGGRFFEETGFWQRVADFVPSKDEIPMIVWERNPDTPVGELITEETKAMFRKIFP